jgi:hypothetical protein
VRAAESKPAVVEGCAVMRVMAQTVFTREPEYVADSGRPAGIASELLKVTRLASVNHERGYSSVRQPGHRSGASSDISDT